MKLSHIKQKPLARAVHRVAGLLLLGAAFDLSAAPVGGKIIAGEGLVNQSGLVTNVQQQTQLLAIEWESFNLDNSEIVNFYQPNSSAWVLNQILQNGPSQINGRINANGNVLLINPRGMIFGDNAVINAGTFVASSLWMDKSDFLNGDFFFKDIDPSQGQVINHGLISAATGGGIHLLGESVSNSGLLKAQLGHVSLAAGSEAYLTFDENQFLGLKITKAALNNDEGLRQAVENQGQIIANEGSVVLKAETAEGLFDQAVNHSGLIEASGFTGGSVDIKSNSGSVQLDGVVKVNGLGEAGSIDVFGRQVVLNGELIANGKHGGDIKLLGDRVGLFAQANIDVSGRLGGGSALIGGDYQGLNSSIHNAQYSYIGENTTISADALEQGDGGRIIVWADKGTQFYGNLSARGGALNGDGGFVETSGKLTANLFGTVDISAGAGQGGSWLIDPLDITITADVGHNELDVASSTWAPTLSGSTVSAGLLEVALAGGDVIITTAAAGAEVGNITVAAPISAAGSGSLTLNADANILINADISVGGSLSLTGVDLTLSSGLNLGASSFDFSGMTGNLTGATLGLTVGGSSGFTSSDLNSLNLGTDSLSISLGVGDDSLSVDDFTTKLTGVTAGSVILDFGGGSDSLLGSTGDDSLSLSSANVLVDGTVSYQGIDSFDGNGGQDTIDLNENDVTLATGFVSGLITFNDVDEASNTGNLSGGSGNDTFSHDGTELTANGTVFLGVDNATAIDGGGGSDTLLGTAGDDSFDITAANTIAYQGINFSGIETLDGAGEALRDEVNIDPSDSLSNQSVNLSGSNFTHQSITVSNIERVLGADLLVGSSGADLFVLSDSGLSANSIDFGSQVTGIDGSIGTDSLSFTSSSSANLDLAATVNTFNVGAQSYTGIDNVVFQSGGTDNVNAFSSGSAVELNSSNTVTVNSIGIQGIDSVTGAAGNDVVDLNNSGATLSTTGFTSLGVEFDGFDEAQEVDNLTGSIADEQFSLNTNSIDVTLVGNVTAFKGVNGTVDALGGNDTVVILDSSGGTADDIITIIGAQAATVDGISFSGIENVDANGGANTLEGSASQDSFILQGAQLVSVAGIVVANVDIIDGMGDVDTLTGSASDENFKFQSSGPNTEILSLQAGGSTNLVAKSIETLAGGAGTQDAIDIDNNGATLTATGFESAGINVSSVEIVNNTGTLAGSTGNDQATLNIDASTSTHVLDSITATGSAPANASDFFGVSGNVDLGLGNDSLLGSAADNEFTIDADNEVLILSQRFVGVDLLDGNGGSDSVDIDGAGAQLVSGGFQARTINVSNTATVTNTDVLTATEDPETFTITGNGSVEVNGIHFMNLITVNVGDKSDDSDEDRIVGTAGDDVFVVTGSESVSVAAISFNDVELVDAGANTATGDSVDLNAAGAALVGSDFDASSIRFENIELATNTGTLLGDAADTTFEINSSGVSVNGTSFENISGTIDAGTGSDTILGTSGNDTFIVSAANTVSANGQGFSNIQTVDAGTNTVTGDSVNLGAAGATLVGSDFDGSSIRFENIELATNTGTLLGDAASSTFEIQSSGVSVNGISFEGISGAIDAGTGSDTILGTTGDDAFIVSAANTVSANGQGFSNIQTVDAATNAATGDSVNLGAAGAALAGSNFDGSSIRFENIELATNTGALLGDAADSTFAINSSGVSVNGISFDGISGTIDAGTGFDTILGTTGDDAFIVSGANTVSANGQGFSNIQTVDAGTNAATGDSVNLGAAGAALAGSDFDASSIRFENIELATNTGALLGDAADSTFEINSGGVSVNGISFEGIGGSIDAGTGSDTILGTTGDDAFIVSAANTISANGQGFSNIQTVDAGTNTATGDSVNLAAAGAALVGSDFDGSSIRFENIELATNTGALLGDAADSTFEINSGGVSVNGISFEGIGGSIDAGTGSDTILGTTGDDAFTVSAANTISANGQGFSNIQIVDAGTNTATGDSVNLGAAGASLAGSDFDASSIRFENIELATNTGTLLGDAADSTFEINSSGVSVNGTSFENISGTIDAGAGSDTILGTNGNDAFIVSAANTVSANGQDFSNIQTVDAGANTITGDSVNLGAAGATLVGSDFDGSSIRFENVELATNTGALLGDAADSTFEINSSGVSVNGTSFENISGTIDAGTGSDTILGASGDDAFIVSAANTVSANGQGFSNIQTVDAGTNTVTGDSVNLGTNGAALAGSDFDGSSIRFENVELATNTGTLLGDAADSTFEINSSGVSVNGTSFENISGTIDAGTGSDTILGASGDDAFIVSAANTVSANGQGFSNIQTVDAGTNTVTGDSVNLGAAGATLVGSDFDGSSIRFENVELATNTGTLLGDAADSTFEINSSGVSVNGTSFESISGTIDAGTGSDTILGTTSDDAFIVSAANTVSANGQGFSNIQTVDAGANTITGDSVNLGAAGATLVGSDFDGSSIRFENVELASNTGLLTGTVGDDSFEVIGNNSVDVGPIIFSNVDAVDGGGNTTGDSVNLKSAGATLASNGFNSNAIQFSNIELATNTDSLAGDSANSIFTMQGSGVSVNGTNFQGIVGTIDAGGGSDKVVATTGDDTIIVSAVNTANINGQNFSNIQIVDAGSNTVTGDSVNLNAADATLVGSDFDSSSIRFENFERASDTGLLTGTASDDSFAVVGNKSVDVASISFSGVDTVDAGGNTATGDSVNLNAAGATLVGSDFNGSAIRFENIERASNTGLLTGTASDDSFAVVGNKSVDVASISFSGVNTVDGGGNTATGDTVNLNAADATLVGSDFNGSSIRFENIERASNTGLLTGTASDDSFEVVGNNSVDVESMSFTGVDAVNGGTGTQDAIDIDNNGATLTATGFESAGINVSSVELVNNTGTLAGSTGNDQATLNIDASSSAHVLDSITATGSGPANASDFFGVSGNVDLGLGNDSLLGSVADNKFTIGADNEVLILAQRFVGVDLLDGNGGSDSVDIAGAGATLASGGFNSNAIEFTGVELTYNTGSLAGDSNGSTFTIESNGVGVNGTVFQAVMGTINAGSGSDTVVATASNDVIAVSASGTADINGQVFSGIEAVDGGSGEDTVDLDGTVITGVDVVLTTAGFQSLGIDFSAVEQVNNVGDINSDAGSVLNSFVQIQDASSAIRLYDLDEVFALNSITSLSGVTNSIDLSFLDFIQFNQTNDPANLSDINLVDLGLGDDAVLGTSLVDSFRLAANSSGGYFNNTVIYDTDAPNVYAMRFQGIEHLNAFDGLDNLSIADLGVSVGDGEVKVPDVGVTFSGIEGFADTGNLEVIGSNPNDAFSIEGNQLIRVNGNNIVFNGVTSLVGNRDSGVLGNSVNLNNGGAVISVSGFNSQGIDVMNIKTISNTGSLSGPSSVFSVNGSNSISVNSLNFSGVNSLTASGSANLDGTGATLAGGTLNSAGISFSGLSEYSNVVDIQNVTNFTLVGDGQLSESGITLRGVNTASGSGATGSLNNLGATVSSDNSFTAGQITFSGVSSANNTGRLIGSAANDTFTLISDSNIQLGSISFSGVTGLDGAGGLGDSINLNQKGADLTANGFTVGGFIIDNIEIISDTGALRGTSANEAFRVDTADRVTVVGRQFAGVSSIDGGAGLDQVDTGQFSLSLLDDGLGYSLGAIDVFNAESFLNVGVLSLNAQDNLLVYGLDQNSGAGGFSLANVQFSGVTQVIGKGGLDTVDLSSSGLSLLDGEIQLGLGSQTSTITLSGFNRVENAGALSLSNANDNISFNELGEFVVGSTGLNGVSQLDGGEGTDQIDVFNQGAQLFENGAIEVAGVTLNNIELINNTGALLGSASAENFVLERVGGIDIASYRFDGVSSLDGGAGADTLTIVHGEDVELALNGAGAGRVVFSSIEALASFESIENYTLPQSNNFLLSGDGTLELFNDNGFAGNFTLGGNVALQNNGNFTVGQNLSVTDNAQLTIAGDLQVGGSAQSTNNSIIRVTGSNNSVIIGNVLDASDNSLIVIDGSLSSAGNINIQDSAEVRVGNTLSTQSDLIIDDSANLLVENNIDIVGDLNAGGSSAIQTNSEINIAGSVTTSQGAQINAQSINVNVPEEKVITVQPDVDISVAVFSEIKVFVNSNSSVRDAGQDTGLYSDDDVVSALIDSAEETEGGSSD